MRFLVLSAIFLNFSYIAQAETKANSEQEYIPYAYEVMDKFKREVREQLGLVCIGDGERMSRDVDQIQIILQGPYEVTVKEARELHVKCTEKLALLMNTDEKIRPFLRKYPADHENASVSISFKEKVNRAPLISDVCSVFEARNKIFYNRRERESGHLTSIKEEPYEEAVKIVHGSGSAN